MDLKEKVVKGLGWTALQKWGAQAIQFLVFWILVRLLDPEAFGLIALSLVYVAFVQIFLDQGLGRAIVQRADLEPAHLDTAFWTNLLFSIFLTGIGITLSGKISSILNEPQIQPIIAWLSLSFILFSLSATQQAILERNLDFKNLAVRSLISQTCGGVAGIGAALAGLGAWSLVIQYLTSSFIGVVVLWGASDWRPGFRFSYVHFRDLFNFGASIIGINLTRFLNTRLDDLLIGYYLGATYLGYYTVAYRLFRIMIDLFSGITATIFFPTFSRIQKDLKRVHRVFYQVTQYTSIIVFPAFIGIAVIAPELVPTFFGSQWEPSIPVMQVLAFAGLLQSILRFNGTVIVALGKPNWILFIRIFGTVIKTLGFFLVAPMGIVPVAIAYTVATYVEAPLYIWASRRLFNLNLKQYLNCYTIPLMATIAMVATLFGLHNHLDGLDNDYIFIGINVLVGSVIYLTVIYLLWPSVAKQFLDFIRAIWSKWVLKKNFKYRNME